MKEAILGIAVIAVMVFGYFLTKRLDLFLAENRKCAAEEPISGTPLCRISFELVKGSISGDTIKRLSERYPSVEMGFTDNRLNLACKKENKGEIMALVGEFLTVVEKDTEK